MICRLIAVVAAGEGIDLTQRGDGAAFRARHGLHGPLLMYAGRADLSKNIPLLLGYLREYWARRGTPLTLIRTGRDRWSCRRRLARSCSIWAM